MRLEKALIKSGHAKSIKEARIIIEKTRPKYGSDEDYFIGLQKMYGITPPPKKTVKPKVIRKRWKIFFQLLILIAGFPIVLKLFIDKDWQLAIAVLALALATFIYLDKRVENKDREDTLK